MGPIEQNIIAQAKRCRDPIPERIRNKPRLHFNLSFFLDAFLELDTDRDVGMGFGPIPWSSLHNYAVVHELCGGAYDDFMYLLRQLDNAYIKHITSKGANSGQSA